MRLKKLWSVPALLLLFAVAAWATNESVGQWMGMAPANWHLYASAAAENNTVAQPSQSTLLSACYTNQSVNDLTLLVFNSATVPADGAVTPILCGPIPKATGTLVSVGCYTPPAPVNFSTGLSVAVSSGAACYTKTTPGAPAGMFTVQFK